jgi:hypothetical protein
MLGGRQGDRVQNQNHTSPWRIPAVEGSTSNRNWQLHHGSANGRPRNDAEDIWICQGRALLAPIGPYWPLRIGDGSSSGSL